VGIEDAQDLILDLEQAIKVGLKYDENKLEVMEEDQCMCALIEDVFLIFQW